MKNPKDWSIEFHDKDLGSGYATTVKHPKDHEPHLMTSDGTVILLHYAALKGAAQGQVTWDLGIRNEGGLPPRQVAIVALVGGSAVALVRGSIRGTKVTKKSSAKR
ncbi:MAG: hypothetical protein ABI432_06980 [Flavobacteriales bacterium]